MNETLRLLIVEDEPPIAKYLAKACRRLLGQRIASLETCHSLEQAERFLTHHTVDLCFLDLNLNGEDGFELLTHMTGYPFHTVVVSAHTERAFEAFAHGVLDFLGKPFDDERLALTFQRYDGRPRPSSECIQFISLRKRGKTQLVAVAEAVYFKAAGIYVEVVLDNGHRELLCKTMDRLEQLLPPRFLRVHRSILVNLDHVFAHKHIGGGTYQLVLKDGQCLPLSRPKYKELKHMIRGL
ncbi:Response regulator transcription factor [Sulfidibacter corallicola]|uniref:Response regulator transcription factor n=1 Tax=Sulfidibacter corallicola TaxID=2818388 RepID=A0A8A4TK06_SULCO|nr:LytTR family DNA-binding domain-containing protein [Sulfidibacter corallicola]QTD49534.1 response regulator transcription factor [Sulfidibacter corallicola]